jgi:hypothetical protein
LNEIEWSEGAVYINGNVSVLLRKPIFTEAKPSETPAVELPLLNELQALISPLLYEGTAGASQYSAIQAKFASLEQIGTDQKLLRLVNECVRTLLGMEQGDPAAAASHALSAIEDYKRVVSKKR